MTYSYGNSLKNLTVPYYTNAADYIISVYFSLS